MTLGVMMLAAVLQAGIPQGTGLRGGGRFLVVPRADRIRLTVRSIQVSKAYDDSLSMELYAGDGRRLSHKAIEAGGEATFDLAGKDGPFLVTCMAGRNAVDVVAEGAKGQAEGADVLVDQRSGPRLRLFGHAQPLYFLVGKTDRLVLPIYAEEPAEVGLYAPDGTQVWHQAIPDHTNVEVSVAVREGWQNKVWRLEAKLTGDAIVTLDPAIVPLLAQSQQAGASLPRALREASQVDLDGRPASPRLLTVQKPATPRTRVRSGDGLEMALSADACVVSCSPARVKAKGPWPWGGFAVRDHSQEGKLILGRGSVDASGRKNSAELRVKFAGSPYELRAMVKGEADCLAVRGTVSSRASEDRCITLMFFVPVPDAAQWFDDLDRARVPVPSMTMANWRSSGAGANRRVSPYPLACVTGGDYLGKQAGLAGAIPLDRPCIFRWSYLLTPGQLILAFDFALTPATAKFPRRADFAFRLYRTDARWGFRDALRRYYGFYPDAFRQRMPKIGGWVCWGNLEKVPDFRDFGFQYHWGPGGLDAVAFDDKHGVYSFLYNDSVRYFADLGAFDHRPTHEEANAVFKELLTTDDPRGLILSRDPKATGRARYRNRERRMGREKAEQWLKDSLEAARRSACTAADGSYQIGYIINRKDWGPPNWWTGRLFCNPDPDLPGGYGDFLIQRIIKPTFDRYHEQGGDFDGIGLDNYFVYADMLDFRREHFAYVDHPLSFDPDTLRPVAVGDFLLDEWVSELRRWLTDQGKWLIANQGHWPYPFAARLLDIHGFEWGIERSAVIARSLAYHKPVVSLPVQDQHYEEPFIRAHVRFGFLPGGYATEEFARRPGVRELYKKYIPALLACARAGWEPVTYAASDNSQVKVERFGRPGGPLLLSITNSSDEGQKATITVQARRLGVSVGAERREIADMIGGRKLLWRQQGGEMVCSLRLGPRQGMVVQLAGE